MKGKNNKTSASCAEINDYSIILTVNCVPANCSQKMLMTSPSSISYCKKIIHNKSNFWSVAMWMLRYTRDCICDTVPPCRVRVLLLYSSSGQGQTFMVFICCRTTLVTHLCKRNTVKVEWPN